MARLTALPSIDIIHGFKGTLDFYLWKGLPCARKWPYNPKSHHSQATIAAAATFGAVLKFYALLADTVLASFKEDAKDHTRTARDIFMSAKYGKLHSRTVPPPPPPPEEIMITGSWLNADAIAYSTSAYAWKGNFVKPMLNLQIHALGAKGDWPQGISLKFGLFTVSDGLIASVIYKSTGFTLPAALDVNPSVARIWETLDPPWTLAADTMYLLMIGRTDGADNYTLPISYPTAIFAPPFAAHEIATLSGRVAKADPTVGDAVNTCAGTAHLHATWSYS